MKFSTLRLGLDRESSDHRRFWTVEADFIDFAANELPDDERTESDGWELEPLSGNLINFQTHLESRFSNGWSAAAEVHHMLSKKGLSSTRVRRSTRTKTVLKVRRFLEAKALIEVNVNLERVRFRPSDIHYDKAACGRALQFAPRVIWFLNPKTAMELSTWFTKRLGSNNTCFDHFGAFDDQPNFGGKEISFSITRTF